jgi:hypothetical protein
LSPRVSVGILGLFSLLLLGSCAARRQFGPAAPEDVREALSAWERVQERAASLPPSRLLYDARLGTSGMPSLPGTLAVTYEGDRIRRASLTGPFGSRIADYGDGVITGDDRKAFLVDPEAMRSVLAGAWAGPPASVAGRNGLDFLLVWNGAYRAEGVLDLQAPRLRSLSLSGSGGTLAVSYGGRVEPWPERIDLKDDRSGRSLSLSLIATEPLTGTPGGP